MEDRSTQVLAIGTTFFILAWIVVLLRVYVRAYMIKSWGVDDWAMMLALLCFTVYLVAQLTGVYYGTGRLDQDIHPDDRRRALRVRRPRVPPARTLADSSAVLVCV